MIHDVNNYAPYFKAARNSFVAQSVNLLIF
ncbi:hypothetical protein N643_02250 [Salmonella bongori serovar 48:z41:-- str. RKS3044]|nr:hypothetical protein N643_02250 [Salmonella bongori serovar 48:z41:-- str. RKS3044]